MGCAPEKIRQAVRDFKAVEHRLEFVATIRGVDYYNDSKATNVDATIKALESFPANIHLILGGKDKGSDYTVLNDLLRQRVKRVYTIGAAAAKIESQIVSSKNGGPKSSTPRHLRTPSAKPMPWRRRATSSCWPRPAPALTSSRVTSIGGKCSKRSCSRWRVMPLSLNAHLHPHLSREPDQSTLEIQQSAISSSVSPALRGEMNVPWQSA